MSDLVFMLGGLIVALVWSFLRGRKAVINKRYRDDARLHSEVSKAVSGLSDDGDVDSKLLNFKALR